MAYNVATEQRAFINTPNGSGTIAIRYTGNAGETPITIEYSQSLSSTPGADYLRAIAIAQLNVLNTTANFISTQVALPLPSVLDTTTPVTPPASTFGNFITSIGPFTPGTTPTDIATIFGSATKSVTVIYASISTIQTTAGINAWSLIKRSAANTGGTSATPVKVPTNSIYPAATATVLNYTANPSGLGTAVGNVWGGRVAAPSVTSVVADRLEVPLLSNQSITLTGVTQGLAVNFGGVALPSGLSVVVTFAWNEQ